MDEKNSFNVLVVHNYYQIPGGEDRVVANEIQLLKDYGHDVISYFRYNNDIKKHSILSRLKLLFKVFFNFRTYKDIKACIKNNKIDIVHVHNTLPLISPAVYYAAVDCNIPVVVTIHNYRMICPGAVMYREGRNCDECLKKGLICAIKYKCYRNSFVETLICVMNTFFHRWTGIYRRINYICLTEFNRKKLEEINSKKNIINKEMIYVKPNFVDEYEDFFTYDRREGYVYAGRLEESKGIKFLLNIWSEMEWVNDKLYVCGRGELEEWCREKANGSNGRIVLMGQLENYRVRKLIAGCKALIFPTQLFEGFPMSIIEAYSSGTPVIGSNIGNTSSIIADDLNGLKFSVNDEKDFKEKMHYFIENLSNSNEIYKSTLNIYRLNYSREKNYEIMKDIYDKVIYKQKK